jgi:hypothetical protein
MKRLYIPFLQLLALFLFGVATAAQSMPDFYSLMANAVGEGTMIYLVGGGTLGSSMAMASWLAKIASDPETFHKWSQMAIKQGEQKTEFTESEIGMSWGDDGPQESQRVAAAPIKFSSDLSAGGKYMDVVIKNPLITGTSNILNTGRYEGQKHVGAEEEMKRHTYRVPIDKYSLVVGESDVIEGEQYTANMTAGKLMKGFVDNLTDAEAQRKDTGLWFAACAGYDIHHFINASKRAGASNGAVPIADVAGGVRKGPEEHPRLYVWSDGKMNKVTYNATQKTYESSITTAISAVKADDKPTLSLLRQINRQCLNSSMIPCLIRDNKDKLRKMFLVYVPGGVKDLLEDDQDYKDLMNGAYQGAFKDNPLLHADDVVYKNLIIRDSIKLDEAEEDYFTVKNSFNAIATANTDTTVMTYNVATVNGVEKLSITPGVRQFTAASAAATAFSGVANTQVLKRVFVFGAGALVRATGKHQDLKYKKEDDYGNEAGVSKTCLFGQSRVQKYNIDGTLDSVPQSFEVFVLGEQV